MATLNDDSESMLLGLPAEIRTEIWTYLVASRLNKVHNPKGEHKSNDGSDLTAPSKHHKYLFHLDVARTCRQLYDEVIEVLRRENIFVHIDTPWPQAIQHIELEGKVPVLARDEFAKDFQDAHLTVSIDAPRYESHDADSIHFVILVEDLPAFTEFWFYQSLTYPGLNENLRLQLSLKNPSPRPWSHDDIDLPLSVQRRLLHPFGDIKELYSCEMQGKRAQVVESEMRKLMAEPPMSAQACLEKSASLKDQGNAVIKTDPHKALEFYTQAWRAIHIVVEGRRRMIWAEPYFVEGALPDGPFQGQDAAHARLMLRITLVANTIQAYINAEDYEEAYFWGCRSINTMRGNFGRRADVPYFQFPAASTWGKVFYRTGIAAKNLDILDKWKEFVTIAGDWLPNDEIVQRERREAGYEGGSASSANEGSTGGPMLLG